MAGIMDQIKFCLHETWAGIALAFEAGIVQL